jgi:predicted exporter
MKRATGRMNNDSEGLGTVTPEMIRQRARELAVINGRTPEQVLDADLEEARAELLGEVQQEAVENLPESKRWDPVPGTPGRRARTSDSQDEQTLAVELVEEGVQEAEHERMLRATREAERRDRHGT